MKVKILPFDNTKNHAGIPRSIWEIRRNYGLYTLEETQYRKGKPRFVRLKEDTYCLSWPIDGVELIEEKHLPEELFEI